MAKKLSVFGKSQHEPTFKKTSQSANPASLKTSSMNKSKRRSHKAYRGQGR
jgi:hypothetical protein